MPVLFLLVLVHLSATVHSSPFKPKGDDIIIIGGSGNGGSGAPIVMNEGGGGRRGKGSTIIIIPPAPPSPFPRTDSMFGAASYDAMPVMSPAPVMGSMMMNHHHQHQPHHYLHSQTQHGPPPPPPYPRFANHMMPAPPNYFGEPSPTISTAKKKKKKKKKKPATTTTTTTTPAPQVSPMYGPPAEYPQDTSTPLENFYYAQESSNNNGFGGGQPSYMPAMMKMLQRYAGSSTSGENVPPPMDGGERGEYGDSGKGGMSNTYEFPKIPQIIIKVPAPIVNVPQPIVNVPAAIVNVSVPEIRVPQTQVTIPAPIVNVPTPVVNVPAANVSVNVPNITVPPAIVNVPKKLVLRKELKIASSKPMGGGRGMMRSNGYPQMADSAKIEFDDDNDDESYSLAGSSHRQDKANLNYAQQSSYQNQIPEQGSVVYVQENQVSVHPTASRAQPSSRPRHNPRTQPRPQVQQQADNSFQGQNANHQSQQAYERPTRVQMQGSQDSSNRQEGYNIPAEHSPVQQHFAKSPPLPYQPPFSKQTSNGPNAHRYTGPSEHEVIQSVTQFDDEAQQSDVGESPDQRPHQDRRQQQRHFASQPYPRPPGVTENEVIEFLRKNNYKPLSKNLQVMRDEEKEPNIIFEKTESPVSESVSFESDQTILDDKSTDVPPPDPRNNQHPSAAGGGGIVFEEIPAHEFTAIDESDVSASDSMIYEGDRDSSAYQAQPIVPHHKLNPSLSSSAPFTAPGSRSATTSARKSVIRRRKKIPT